jgi:hypothetical protein
LLQSPYRFRVICKKFKQPDGESRPAALFSGRGTRLAPSHEIELIMIKRLRSILVQNISIAWAKLLISVVAIGLIVARLYYPDLKIDAVALGLVIVAIIPWMTDLIDTAKFPGGWEIKFRDVKIAADKVTAGLSENHEAKSVEPAQVNVLEQDPNMAIIKIRIGIEERLRKYARIHRLENTRGLQALLDEVSIHARISDGILAGLSDLILAGNRAAHGAKVQEEIADWAVEEGPKILAALDQELEYASRMS